MQQCRLCKQKVQSGQTHYCSKRSNAAVTTGDRDSIGSILVDIVETAVDVGSSFDSDDDGGDDGGDGD